jgi:PD-(D/E)XK endonuclease
VLTTDQKGAVAESAIAYAAIKLGVGVYKPLSDGGRYDVIFDLGSQLVRVQCKSAVHRGSVLAIPCYSARRCRGGFVKRPYAAAEIDAIAAYSPELDRCFFIPFDEIPGRTCLQLRLDACRNNQRRGINWANDFDFAARLTALLGAIAQLGERCDGIAEVAGSSPAGSTFRTLRKPPA